MLENGFEIIENFVSEEILENILKDVNFSVRTTGIRNAEKRFTSIAKLVNSQTLLNKVEKYFTGTPKLVRAILFNKTPESNWLVSWHQDRTVAVNTYFNKEGWGAWSKKENIHHVQPPIEVLNQMATFRIHLDPSTTENGCLNVIPNSHKQGIIPQEHIGKYVNSGPKISCIANRGSALVMRPHLLHSSSKGLNPSQRRVLHLEFSNYKLPTGVTWA